MTAYTLRRIVAGIVECELTATTDAERDEIVDAWIAPGVAVQVGYFVGDWPPAPTLDDGALDEARAYRRAFTELAYEKGQREKYPAIMRAIDHAGKDDDS